MANVRGLPLEIRILPVEGDRATDHLNDLGAGPLRQLPGDLLRLEIGPLPELDLDQLPGAEGIVERLDDGVSESLPAHVHRWRQAVSFGSENGSILSFHDMSGRKNRSS
jgi:hypothetical protein